MNDARLPIDEAARFVADKHNSNAYRKQCIEFWRNLHGDDYADRVRTKALELIKKGKK